jgi:hypothetical protein
LAGTNFAERSRLYENVVSEVNVKHPHEVVPSRRLIDYARSEDPDLLAKLQESFAVMGVLTIGAFAQLQNSSKAQDESELRRIESDSGKFEQQNDSKWMDLLADDWILLGGTKVLAKSELQANVKQNFTAHNGPNPYTIEKNYTRVDLFGDTAVVPYIKEYRQTADTTKVYDQDNTDVFTRSLKGWRLRLTKVSDAPVKAN